MLVGAGARIDTAKRILAAAAAVDAAQACHMRRGVLASWTVGALLFSNNRDTSGKKQRQPTVPKCSGGKKRFFDGNLQIRTLKNFYYQV